MRPLCYVLVALCSLSTASYHSLVHQACHKSCTLQCPELSLCCSPFPVSCEWPAWIILQDDVEVLDDILPDEMPAVERATERWEMARFELCRKIVQGMCCYGGIMVSWYHGIM